MSTHKPCPVDLLAQKRGEQQGKQTHYAHRKAQSAEQLHVAHDGQHQQKSRYAGHEPERLLEGQSILQPEDEHHAYCGQKRGERQKIRVGSGRQKAHAKMRYGEYGHEDERVEEWTHAHLVPSHLQVHQHEPEDGQREGRYKKDKFAITRLQSSVLNPSRNCSPSRLPTVS